MSSSTCEPSACIGALGLGGWHGSTWQWDPRPPCCEFGHVGPQRAAALLGGRSIAFVGDSQTRRHMWAVVDAVGGASRAVRRHQGHVVPDSHRDFDAKAVSLNDTIYDSQRAYHAGQTVLLNVETGHWKLIDPTALCGVDRRHWMTDHRLVHALQKGHSEPWGIMRGSQYRLLFTVVLKPNATAPTSELRVRSAERVRRTVEALAREALRGWGCQKARIQDCSFDQAIQRNCARRLTVSEATPSGSGASVGRAGGSRPGVEWALMVTMGEMGGSCAAATRELRHRLEVMLEEVGVGAMATAGGEVPGDTTLRQLRSGQMRRQLGEIDVAKAPGANGGDPLHSHNDGMRAKARGGGRGGGRGGVGRGGGNPYYGVGRRVTMRGGRGGRHASGWGGTSSRGGTSGRGGSRVAGARSTGGGIATSPVISMLARKGDITLAPVCISCMCARWSLVAPHESPMPRPLLSAGSMRLRVQAELDLT